MWRCCKISGYDSGASTFERTERFTLYVLASLSRDSIVDVFADFFTVQLKLKESRTKRRQFELCLLETIEQEDFQIRHFNWNYDVLM